MKNIYIISAFFAACLVSAQEQRIRIDYYNMGEITALSNEYRAINSEKDNRVRQNNYKEFDQKINELLAKSSTKFNFNNVFILQKLQDENFKIMNINNNNRYNKKVYELQKKIKNITVN